VLSTRGLVRKWFVFKRVMLSAKKTRRRYLEHNKWLAEKIDSLFPEYPVLLDMLVCPYCRKKFSAARCLANHLLHRHYEDMRRDFELLVGVEWL
jgi:hypothetical protein